MRPGGEDDRDAAGVSPCGRRVALGARRSNVLGLVLGRAATAAGAGVAGGLAGAIALRKVIATQLIGISGTDPLVLGTVAAVIFGGRPKRAELMLKPPPSAGTP